MDLFTLLKLSTSAQYTCGDIDNFAFSGMLPYVVSTIIKILKFAIPIILVVFGMIDLLKAVIASKEDEIKKAQMTFVKRLIAAALVFFIVMIVQMVIRFLSGGEQTTVMGCFNCFVNGQEGNGNVAACELTGY